MRLLGLNIRSADFSSPSALSPSPYHAVFVSMSSLDEIEAAAESLSPERKQELLLFLAARIRASGARPPAPRKFCREQVGLWIAEDEADMKRFPEGR
jgi:hypothetical protein